MSREADMSRNRYSRRRFLVGAAVLGSATVLGIGLAARRATQRAGSLAGLLDDVEQAHEIGSAWLAANPGEAEPVRLEERLLADLGAGARGVASHELRRRVADRIRSDYAEGRVDRVEGWVLSTTELRLCALAAGVRGAGKEKAAR